MRTLFIFLSLATLVFAWRALKLPLSILVSHLVSKKKAVLTKNDVADALKHSASFYRFPTEIELSSNGKQKNKIQGKVNYSFDVKLQRSMESFFQSYGPDYGAFVAIDPVSGRILSMVSFSKQNKIKENLALRATFPSASVFKVVTAAAAIEEHKISADTLIPFNGRKHTLYKGQIFKNQMTRWTQFITLKDAFAHSINTVFGKIGVFTVGSHSLRDYAGRFGFNRKIIADFSIEEGHALIPEDSWGLAESASGFTRGNTMSPLQGALIAASVANHGVIMEPYMVQSIAKADGSLLYSAVPKVAQVAIDPDTARVIRSLMKETVMRGTSRSSFRGFFRKDFSFMDVGGKTGSLTGDSPPGKYDWFVGYADSGSQRIAFAALTIHQKQWRVKSSYLARLAIESYFRDSLRHPSKTVAKTVVKTVAKAVVKN